MRILTFIFIISVGTCSAQFKSKRDTIQSDTTIVIVLKPAQEQYLLQLQNQIQNLSNPEFVKQQIEQMKAEQQKAILLLFGEAILPETITYNEGVLKAKRKK